MNIIIFCTDHPRHLSHPIRQRHKSDKSHKSHKSRRCPSRTWLNELSAPRREHSADVRAKTRGTAEIRNLRWPSLVLWWSRYLTSLHLKCRMLRSVWTVFCFYRHHFSLYTHYFSSLLMTHHRVWNFWPFGFCVWCGRLSFTRIQSGSNPRQFSCSSPVHPSLCDFVPF